MRNKIGRSYYALYHHAINFHNALPEAEKGGLRAHTGGVHQQLIDRLCNPSVRDVSVQSRSRSIGTFLSLARALRDRADYHHDQTVTATDVVNCTRFVSKGLTF